MERRLLLVLLAHAGEAVSVDRLVDALWGETPPRSAERTLHAYVARLRRLLEPGRARGADPATIVTSGRGYRLVVAGSQVDAARFESETDAAAQLLETGDAAAARECFVRALGFWRGDEAYAEIADSDVGRTEQRRLGEVRAVALEHRIECDLASGATQQLVAELEALVAEYPFRERLWGQLMVALYRAGRQADALQAFQRARRSLVDELGVEPGPELRELEAAVLAHDPSLLAPSGRRAGTEPRRELPIALESMSAVVVGREAEQAALEAAWADAVSGRGRVRLGRGG